MTISALFRGLMPKAFRKKPPVDAEAEEGDEVVATEPAPPAPFPALVPWLVIMGGMSVVAVALGIGVGLMMVSSARRDANAQVAQDAQASDSRLINLPPIVTNIADPANAWVRLQTSIVVDKSSAAKSQVLAAEIADDILGFMKTVTLPQIAGASGLQHLREDLTERAVIRSDGRVRELILQTLVVQ